MEYSSDSEEFMYFECWINALKTDDLMALGYWKYATGHATALVPWTVMTFGRVLCNHISFKKNWGYLCWL